MPILCVGKTEIPYEIRRSENAKRKRIIVTPDKVEVVAPCSLDEQDIVAFVQNKRRWVYDKQEEMNEVLARYEQDRYSRLQSGAKVPFRGRNMRVRIARTPDKWERIEYRNGFYIYVPDRLADTEAEACAGIALTFWLKDRLKEDVKQLAGYYSEKLGVTFRTIKVQAPPKLWGSCTKLGTIIINWHLIAAPKAVLEYVVLHELCHLQHRNHSDAFWSLLSTHMPDYTTRKRWLEHANPQYHL